MSKLQKKKIKYKPQFQLKIKKTKAFQDYNWILN